MNRLNLIAIAVLLYWNTPLFAQNNIGKNAVLTDINGVAIYVEKPENAVGSPMLTDVWSIGNVKFANGKKADSVALKFDLEKQKLLTTNLQQILEYTDEVQEFVFSYVEGSLLTDALFKSGYPETDGHKSSALYRVLAEGPKIQLLQYTKKEAHEVRTYNQPLTINYLETNTLYVYDTLVKTIHKVKCKKSSVTGALSAYEQSIERLCADNNWDLKTVDQLKLLIQQLK